MINLNAMTINILFNSFRKSKMKFEEQWNTKFI